MATEPKGHLNHFPTTFPADEITIVINGIRGIPDNHTLRDRIEAAWWVVGYGASMTPEAQHTEATAPLTEAQVADHLESLSNGKMIATLPWAAIIAVMLQLIQKWLSGA